MRRWDKKKKGQMDRERQRERERVMEWTEAGRVVGSQSDAQIDG